MSDQLQLQRQERQLGRKHHTQLPAEERLRQQSDALHQLHIWLQGENLLYVL